MKDKALYPRAFKIPEGKAISITCLKNACRIIRKNPSKSYSGWNWFETPGYFIINSVMDGINDRINRRYQHKIKG